MQRCCVAPQVVLVHAPLVGPSTWRWVAQELRARGVEVVVPRLQVDASAEAPFDQLVSAVASEVTSDHVVLVGHSGAGVLLPFIAEASSFDHARLVFVDAGLPPLEGAVELAAEDFRRFLRGRADENGLLAPWHTWWGEDGMSRMVGDEERRAEVSGDTQQLPLSYYDRAPVVPRGWSAHAAGYLLLSEVYRPAAMQASALGWSVLEVLGTHLELVNRPADVAASIIAVAGLQ